ncbi:MAG: PIG-L family deacetylase [Myxococcota bacterium]
MTARAIWLSPHLDDAVLSSGGAIASLVRAGAEVEVLTVCTAAPSGPLSPLAEDIHARWGLAADEVLRVRRAEDSRALQILGAAGGELGLLDAIYRLPSTYLSYAALFDVPVEHDPLSDDLARALAGRLRPDAEIYAPLGIGGHVDHRLVFAYALGLARAGRRVWFYEDLPYALRPADRAAWERAPVGPLVQRLIPLDAAALAAKIQAIAAYSSQLPALFGSAAAMPEAITAYATAVGGSAGPAERCFSPTVIHTPRD